jgi:hypothetical protein
MWRVRNLVLVELRNDCKSTQLALFVTNQNKVRQDNLDFVKYKRPAGVFAIDQLKLPGSNTAEYCNAQREYRQAGRPAGPILLA